jgi:lipopolysaccharide/colanic/teichoic acid biosynthesis glycosyltransferase
VSSDPGFSRIPEGPYFSGGAVSLLDTARQVRTSVQQNVTFIDAPPHRQTEKISAWSRSSAKRIFDLACVTCSLPISLPILLAIGLAVRITSRGPVLFRQRRVGRNSREFTIYKFRTMPVHDNTSDRPSITTHGNQEFTLVGPFLRRFKLDELPNLYNVLRGDMSLVGPRPKLPQHQPGRLHCRPGITGRATVVFAKEEEALSRIPEDDLDAFYHSVILPLKVKLDSEYMASATFASDFKLLVISVLRYWKDRELKQLLPDYYGRWNQAAAERPEESMSAPSVLAAQKIAMTAQRQKD